VGRDAGVGLGLRGSDCGTPPDIARLSRLRVQVRPFAPRKRVQFLEAVAQSSFRYVVCTLDKREGDGWLKDRQWQDKECSSRAWSRRSRAVCSNRCRSRERLGHALNERITADDNQDKVYFSVLRTQFQALKSRVKQGRSLVKKVKPGDSSSQVLLQLADMVCGAVVRSFGDTNEYRKLIKSGNWPFIGCRKQLRAAPESRPRLTVGKVALQSSA